MDIAGFLTAELLRFLYKILSRALKCPALSVKYSLFRQTAERYAESAVF